MAVLNLHSLNPPRIPEGAVYIGRANPRLGLPQSPYANPFVIKGVRNTAARAKVIEQYRQWLWDKIRSEHFTLDDLVALSGKHLVCYCAPMACHGNVLQKAVRWAVEKKAALESGEGGSPVEPGPSEPGPAHATPSYEDGASDSSRPGPVAHLGRPSRIGPG